MSSTKQGRPAIHGMYKTATYKSWDSMKQRCTNPKSKHYAAYGAKGITMDPEWNSFDKFLSDMGTAPEGTSIDRRDNSKGYSKDNCRWATRAEQNNNRSNTIHLTFEGITKPLGVWCKEKGLNPRAVANRVQRYGWDVVRALTTPTTKEAK